MQKVNFVDKKICAFCGNDLVARNRSISSATKSGCERNCSTAGFLVGIG